MGNCNTLFVYGSLRKGFREPGYAYISQHFKHVGDAITKGSCFKKDNTLVVTNEPSDEIPGELYIVEDNDVFDWVMMQIDDYEGLNPDPGKSPLYRRSLTQVNHKGNIHDAWIYWFNGKTDDLTPVSGSEISSLFNSFR